MKTASVSGKVVAVTGGAREIGLAVPTVLPDLGATVAIGEMDESAAKEAGDRLALALSSGLDVTDRESFTEFLDAVESDVGSLDVVVNNAGVIAVGSAVDGDDAITQRLLDGH